MVAEKHSLMVLVLAVVLVVMAWLSLAAGPVALSWQEVWHGLFQPQEHAISSLILQEIRLPRMLLGLLVGSALGIAGAAMQGYLRNPLAEPALLGVTGGAAMGAVWALYGGLAAIGVLVLPLAGMAGALLAVWLVYALAGRNSSTHTLILAGIAVSSLLGAGIALVLNLAENPFAAMEMMFWLMGSLANSSFDQVVLVAPFVLAGMVLLFSSARSLDALSLGEDTARSLGVSMKLLNVRLALGVALAVGAAVSVAGSIGFVGLVVPHLVRPFMGYQPGRVMLGSALMGAILLTAADVAVRFIPTTGAELKLGVVTALLGAPFFLVLLMRTRRSMV